VLKRDLCEAPIQQILDFANEFIFVTDGSEVAFSEVHQQKVDGGLAPLLILVGFRFPSNGNIEHMKRKASVSFWV